MKQLMHSFEGYTAPAYIVDGIGHGDITAVCLFSYSNVQSPSQLRALTDTLYQAARNHGQLPPLIGIDQEGGQLISIAQGATELPGNMALGATRSKELAFQAGMVLGRELLAMGINLNFAPSLDVNNNPQNPVIGTRSFGDDPDQVAKLGTALIGGLQAAGVIATAKHFPGHGDTDEDSHFGVPTVNHSIERLNRIELRPFRTAIEANVPAIMTCHVTYPALDRENPATLSRTILNNTLRRAMAFNGLIITDAMDMHAVSRLGKTASIRAAIAAGADLILLAHLADQAAMIEEFRGLENSVSIERIQTAQRQIPLELPSLDVVCCEEHRQIAQEIADRSITVVRDERHILPLQVTESEQIAVITPRSDDLTPADTSAGVKMCLADAIKKRHAYTVELEMSLKPVPAEIDKLLESTHNAQVVVIGTIQAEIFQEQARVVKALHEKGKTLIVIALRTPYDILAFPMIDTYLCAYSIRQVTTEAVARAIFGEINATGKLPCTIPGIIQA